ncbi:hypothetical protein IJI94_00055 [Candidatus Saccharibacteria bacterium]|nr:hypothetical protein [Candidatus Saccharibacteria bacterium]
MDKYVKQSIDSRKDAIFNFYEVEAGGKKKIDSLFSEIEELGKKCKDVGEFETEFQKSPLNQKYLDLFTEVTTSCQPTTNAKMAGAKKQSIGKIVAEGIVEGAADRAANDAVHAVLPTRAAVNQKIYDEARKTPVLGDAVDVAGKVGFAAHVGRTILKSRKKKEE